MGIGFGAATSSTWDVDAGEVCLGSTDLGSDDPEACIDDVDDVHVALVAHGDSGGSLTYRPLHLPLTLQQPWSENRSNDDFIA